MVDVVTIRRVGRAAPGVPFAPCLIVGQEIAISGVIAHGIGDSMTAQAEAGFAEIAAMLAAAGGGMHNIYKVVIYVTDMARRGEISDVRQRIFDGNFPCSTLVEVKSLADPDALIEIDAFANLGVDLRAAVDA